jgi:hypothetical protein
MLFDDLQQRYGSHIAKRVKHGLAPAEFNVVDLERLPTYLETRAEKAARDYKTLMENPLERGNVRSEVLQKLWREAEDLAYILSIAEDVTTTVRASLVNGH